VSYPDDIESIERVDPGDPMAGSTSHSALHDAVAAIVEALENVLGVNPQVDSILGDFGTVAARLADLAQRSGPAGVVEIWAGINDPPAGWLLCDGSAVSRATYSRLFTAIGETYGPGDGITTFQLPDTRGRFILGQPVSGLNLGATGGVLNHLHSLGSHLHTITHTHQIDPPETESSLANWRGASDSGRGLNSGGEHTAHDHQVNVDAFPSGPSSSPNSGSAGSGSTGQNNPPFLVLRHIIRT
jgi:microcystin-dependent protein